MSKTFSMGALVAGFILLGLASASALPGLEGLLLMDLAGSGSSMPDGAFTQAQRAFITFCRSHADQCESDGKGARVDLDQGKLSDLIEVNDEVNDRIVPDRDGRDYEHWSLETNFGHCNEYAIQKRKALIDRGWPIAALSLAVVHTRWDAGTVFHLVLTIRTDKGDLVLDNLRREIVPWNRTNYGWLMRESAIHPRLWVRIEAPGIVSIAGERRTRGRV